MSNLIGMPDQGVSLAGTPDRVVMQNRTARKIIGYAIAFAHEGGGGETRIELPFLGMRQGRGFAVAPGDQFELQTPAQVRSVGSKGWPIKATLLAVLFDDGEIVEVRPTPLLEIATERINAERDLDRKLLAYRDGTRRSREAVWTDIGDIAAGRHPQSERSHMYRTYSEIYARELLDVRRRQNDAAAFALAEKSAMYPTPWRKP